MEKTLIERLKAFDNSAYTELYNSYFKQSTSVLDNRVDMSMRKDIFQEVLASLYRKIRKGEDFEIKNLGSYLRRACINQATLRLKKEMNTTSLSGEQNEVIVEEEDVSDRHDRLKRALLELGEGCRELLLNFYIKGFDYDELSGIMGLSRDYIKNKKARCMKKLKSIM